MEPYSTRERYINFYTDFAFKRLFGTEYEESLKIYRDWYSITKTAVDKAKKEAHEEGRAEGLAEGRGLEAVRIAKTMKAKGAEFAFISDVTGLSIPDIDNL